MKRTFIILLLSACIAQAQTADEVLDKMTAASLGKNAASGLTSMVMSGTLTAPNGLKGDLMAFRKSGGKIYVKSNLSMGTTEIEVVQACDGSDCYENNPMMGPRMLSGDEKSALLSQNDLDGMLDWRQTYESAELMGSEAVDGQDCYKIAVVSKAGLESVQYVSKATYLMLRTDMTVSSQVMGQMKTVTYLTDYQDFSGFTLPKKMTTEVMSQQLITQIDSYEFNVDIPDAKFEIPEHLKVAQ